MRGRWIGVLAASLAACDGASPSPAVPAAQVAASASSESSRADDPAAKTGQAETGQVETGQVETGQVETGPVAAAQQEPTSLPASDDGYEASVPTPQQDGSALYGSAFADGVAEVTLAELLASPERYADTAVRTGGEISRVCQNMGCWMELKDTASGQELRAPLAGHSYFLPQSAVGKQARVEGKVSVRPLSDAQQAHLRAEGARATGASVSIVASTVAVK